VLVPVRGTNPASQVERYLNFEKQYCVLAASVLPYRFLLIKFPRFNDFGEALVMSSLLEIDLEVDAMR